MIGMSKNKGVRKGSYEQKNIRLCMFVHFSVGYYKEFGVR
jgi:hypothetical protein